MLKTVEGSLAAAEVAKNCEPEVVACYPITPSTHIAEDLEEFYSNNELKSFIAVESEFSAISALIGGSAAGGRTFTATSSQGLALMHEALFCASGMRLPIVMAVANRALSAPLNIWNDHQDSVSERDSGWIQLYCESNQEVVDTIPQAFKIAEKVMLPVMVCMDGFYLTHAVEQIDVPEKELIAKFLPKFKPALRLDSAAPLTIGAYASPGIYEKFREDVDKDLTAAKEVISETATQWGDLTNRNYGNGLWEEYELGDAEVVLVAMGSVCGNIKVVIDELRKKGKKVGLLRLKSLRPFPREITKVLAAKKYVGIFEKALSVGGYPPLFADMSAAMLRSELCPTISSFIGGLGGKDVTIWTVRKMFETLEKGESVRQYV